MRNPCGFTLIETLITTLILVSGLVAVAQLFSYTVAANISNQQRTAATILVTEKIEQLKSVSIRNPLWLAGGGLSPRAPVVGFYDYVSIAADGTPTIDSATPSPPYIRVWQITGSVPRSLTVIVYAQRFGLTQSPFELARAVTMVGDVF
jgi:prepilin-type N-terminal cleavage/methylation domain-containing protein